MATLRPGTPRRRGGDRRRLVVTRAGAALALAAWLAPAPVSAQGASDQAAAEALFKQGRDLMAAGQYSAACPKFVESERLDPAPGTLLNLATCYEKNGQIASAWVTYKEAAVAARKAEQPERARMARERAAEIEPKLPMLTIVVPPASDRPELEIRRDGEVVGRPEWGSPIPVDPGAHIIDASAPGLTAWQGTARVEGPAVKVSIEVPPLEAAPAAPPATTAVPPVAQASPATVTPSEPPPPAVASTAGATQRVVAWVVGGVGLAGIAAGAILGGVAIAKKNDTNGHCIQNVCDQAGFDADQSASDAATGATIALTAGGALVVTSAILYFTAPRTARPSTGSVAVVPYGGAGAAGALVSGSF